MAKCPSGNDRVSKIRVEKPVKRLSARYIADCWSTLAGARPGCRSTIISSWNGCRAVKSPRKGGHLRIEV